MNPTTATGIVRGGPIAATGIWQAVTRAGGGRCTCTGPCGRTHTRTEGRCGTTTPGGRLYAAPADPNVPAAQAHRVPVTDLSAWCGPCLDGARRHTTAPPPTPADDGGALFDLP